MSCVTAGTVLTPGVRKREQNAQAIKYVEKAVTIAATVRGRVSAAEPDCPKRRAVPKWSTSRCSSRGRSRSRRWLAALDRFALSEVRPRIRQQILDGHLPVDVLMNEKVGEIKAQIVERDGKIWMVKDCVKHGHFEDLMSIDTEFSQHLEDVFRGATLKAHNDEKLHHHGSSTVKYGRGSVLTSI